MLKRLRQGNTASQKLPSRPRPDGSTSFMSLPGELRNAIYELVVQDTTLTLVPLKTKTRTPPAMLLVSKQVRAEYRPYLLTRATIIANVSNYNFKAVKSVTMSLYSRDLKLLRENRNLMINLHCSRIHSKDVDSLRRWLVHRNDPLDRLPWSYKVDESAYKSRRVLVEHVSAIFDLQKQLDERLMFELLPISDALNDALLWMSRMSMLAAKEHSERGVVRRVSEVTA